MTARAMPLAARALSILGLAPEDEPHGISVAAKAKRWIRAPRAPGIPGPFLPPEPRGHYAAALCAKMGRSAASARLVRLAASKGLSLPLPKKTIS